MARALDAQRLAILVQIPSFRECGRAIREDEPDLLLNFDSGAKNAVAEATALLKVLPPRS
jgi:hypothetical protein